jgi:alpha-1,2-mannosyltransferase
MLFQSLASLLVGLECILRFPPDVFCDTMGAAFTYPVAYYLANATVVAYVHYPIISTVRRFRVP